MSTSPNSEPPKFNQKAYSEHNALGIHYSSRIFAARVSIITTGLFLTSIILEVGLSTHIKTESLPSVASGGAILLSVLWLLEIGYFKKLNQVIILLRKHDRENDNISFYTKYNPFTHKFIYLSYIVLILFLLWKTDSSNLCNIIIASILILIAMRQIFLIAIMWVAGDQAKYKKLGQALWHVIILSKEIRYKISENESRNVDDDSTEESETPDQI